MLFFNLKYYTSVVHKLATAAANMLRILKDTDDLRDILYSEEKYKSEDNAPIHPVPWFGFVSPN